MAAAEQKTKRSVFLAMDDIESSAYALFWALNYFLRPDDKVTLVHVFMYSPPSTLHTVGGGMASLAMTVAALPDSSTRTLAGLQQHAQALMERYADICREKLKCPKEQIVVKTLHPDLNCLPNISPVAHAITRFVNEELEDQNPPSACFLLLSTRPVGDRESVGSVASPSVALYCMQHAACQVMTIKDPADSEAVHVSVDSMDLAALEQLGATRFQCLRELQALSDPKVRGRCCSTGLSGGART